MSKDAREFDVSIKWIEGKSGDIIVEGMPTIRTGAPPKNYTPEHLLVAAVVSCFMNSFYVFTEKMRISFESFEAEGKGVLEMVGRSFEITQIHVKTRVTIESERTRSKIRRALELGAKYCFVANSLKGVTTYNHEIIVRPHS